MATQKFGLLSWHDETLRSDSLSVVSRGLPAPDPGQAYAAWLGDGKRLLFLGRLAPTPGGDLTARFVSPNHGNLLATWDRVSVARAADAIANQDATNVVLSGTLPAQALVHLRHVLVSFPGTPTKLGFALGLRQETDVLLRHAQFLKESFDEESLALQRLHAEHLVNLIEGSKGPHFGDLNGDGKVDNPGDGFGVLPSGSQSGYLQGMIDHAGFAARSTDASDPIKLHAGHVETCGENARARVTEIRDRALRIFQARSAADPQEDVLRILALAEQTIHGADADGDGQILPIPGGGGVLTAYAHAQLMAGIPLASAGAAADPPLRPSPTAAPSPALGLLASPTPIPPTSTPVAARTAVGAQVAVTIADVLFSPREIRIPVGATIVWNQLGRLPHTVTADDNAFTSDTLTKGASFRVTFSKPGVYQYYCAFHGGPGGTGMAGVVRVQ